MRKYKKRSNKKLFFPNVDDRLKLRINPKSNFNATVNGHGNIKN